MAKSNIDGKGSYFIYHRINNGKIIAIMEKDHIEAGFIVFYMKGKAQDLYIVSGPFDIQECQKGMEQDTTSKSEYGKAGLRSEKP